MGKRGPHSAAPGGIGNLTAQGYIRVWCAAEQRLRLYHDMIWEAVHGPIPKGHCIHHRNGDKLDNRLDNLELVSTLAHKRIHAGCELRDGQWWKPCRKCGDWYAADTYYKRHDGISPWCRPCCIANAVENKRKRKAARHDPQA